MLETLGCHSTRLRNEEKERIASVPVLGWFNPSPIKILHPVNHITILYIVKRGVMQIGESISFELRMF